MDNKDTPKTEYAPFRPFEFAQNVRHEYSGEHISEILSEFSEEELRAQSESLLHLYDAAAPAPAAEAQTTVPEPEPEKPKKEKRPKKEKPPKKERPPRKSNRIRAEELLLPTDHQSWYRLLPMILAAAVTPLIVQLKTYSLPLSQFSWTASTDSTVLQDFYSWYKSIALMIFACLAILVIIIDIIRKRVKPRMSFAFIPAGIIALLVILSYALNGYKEFTLFGWPDRFEGTLTLLAYAVLFCYSILTIKTGRDAAAVVCAFCVSMLILNVIGGLQYAGLDPLTGKTGMKAISVLEQLRFGGIWEQIDAGASAGDLFPMLLMEHEGINQTLSNQNYTAMLLCLSIPVISMLYIRADSKGGASRWLVSPLLWLLLTLCFINAIGTVSSNMVPGLLAALLLCIIVFHKMLKYWTKPLLLIIASLALVMTFTCKTWMPELQNTIADIRGEDRGEDTSGRPYINSIVTEEDRVIFDVGDPECVLCLTLEPDGDGALSRVLASSGGRTLPLAESEAESGTFLIEEEPFDSVFKLCIIREERLFLRVSTHQADWDFTLSDGKALYRNPAGSLVSLKAPVVSDLIKNPKFGTGRGAIWAQTLPMLKDTVLIGKGADSFSIYYPHDNYAYTYSAGMDIDWSADKPHDLFLGAAFSTGWISAAALIVLFAVYLIQCIVLYWRSDMSDSRIMYLGAGIFLGSAALLASALINDSTVSVMPPFWVLLGTGIAVNSIIKRSAGARAEAEKIPEVKE
ncbi:MAG: O-antigen ligase family protein [Firmicutes bacterium]|nr:O-antigen ligase family protein [Bacillota bacterium]